MNKPASPGKAKPETTELRPPKVSIIIPAYNREKYVGLAVRSVLDQTYRDIECIIVDDGSTDGTLAIAEQFAREDDRVRVLSDKTNRGAAYALKTGFEAARGEYVCQVDSDDLLASLALQETVAILDADPECGMVYTYYCDIDENGKQLRVGWRCSHPYDKDKLLTVFMTFHFRLMRKSVYEQAGGFDPEFDKIEDYDLCLKISEITRIETLKKILYLKRIHSNSILNLYRLDVVLLAQNAIQSALIRRGLDTVYKVDVRFNPQYFLELVNSSED